MIRQTRWGLLLAVVSTTVAWSAEPVVDESSPLETIDTRFQLADGPCFDGRGVLYVPDVKAQKVYRYRTISLKRELFLPNAGRISASFFNLGQLYLSDNGNSQIVSLSNKQKHVLADHSGGQKPPRPNDLVVDNQGGIYYTLTREGQVMYLSPEGKRTVAVDSIQTPNGIILSPDEQTLYVSAYRPKQIWAYPLSAPGRPGPGRLFATMDDGEALGADGMTIDRAGHVYCAGAKEIWIWSPSGKLLTKLACPTRPINCTFGDSTMQSLYITGFGGLYRQKMNISGRSPHPPSKAVQQSKSSTRPSTEIPTEIQADLDMVYAEYGDRKVLLDLFRPPKRSSDQRFPCLVIVHGGGWLKGDKTKFRALTIALAHRGYVTAAIEYRLGGEAKFPAAIHDCNAAVRYLRANADRFSIDAGRIGAVGGSAGGHLVGLMATGWNVQELQGDGGHAEQSSRLQAAVVMAGPMQMLTGSVAERSRSAPQKANCNRWIGAGVDEAPDQYRLADAYEHISSDSTPILFMVGEHDHPERNQPAREKLKSHGVWTGLKVYSDGKHGCWNQLPWFQEMVADMDTFFREQMTTR